MSFLKLLPFLVGLFAGMFVSHSRMLRAFFGAPLEVATRGRARYEIPVRRPISCETGPHAV